MRATTIGDNVNPTNPLNGGVLPKDMGALVREYAKAINWQANQRANATSRVKNIRNAVKKQHAEAFETAKRLRAEAREMVKSALVNDPNYLEAAQDRKSAASAISKAYKDAEAAGINPDALRTVVNLGKMDAFERSETWDLADQYAIALGLWKLPEI